MDSILSQVWVRRLVAAAVALQLVVGVVSTFIVEAADPVAAPAAAPLPVEVPQPEVAPPPPPPPVPGATAGADAVVPKVALFEAEGGGEPFASLSNPTFEKVPLIFHVLEDKGAWLHVRVNTRPNGARAWIRRSDVTLRTLPNRIVIDLSDRQLTVLQGNDVLAQHPVAVGAPRAPTPLGEFYVDATVNLPKANGPYGAGQLSVSGFSEVYKTFGGGIGQIAIHGTNNPRSIGGTVSNGCIRMLNAAWIQVASLAANGTPVSIQA